MKSEMRDIVIIVEFLCPLQIHIQIRFQLKVAGSINTLILLHLRQQRFDASQSITWTITLHVKNAEVLNRMGRARGVKVLS